MIRIIVVAGGRFRSLQGDLQGEALEFRRFSRNADRKRRHSGSSDRSWRDLMGIFMGETFPVKGRRGSSAANSVRDREIESLPSRL